MRTTIVNGPVLDTSTLEFVGERTIVYDDGMMFEVAQPDRRGALT